MPWTTADVDKHKKGLTEAQKRKWVSIANAVRNRCLQGDGEPSYCDALAIKFANSKFKERK